MIVLLVLLALGVLATLAGVCAFHLGVGGGRFEKLDDCNWAGLCGSDPCEGKRRKGD